MAVVDRTILNVMRRYLAVLLEPLVPPEDEGTR